MCIWSHLLCGDVESRLACFLFLFFLGCPLFTRYIGLSLSTYYNSDDVFEPGNSEIRRGTHIYKLFGCVKCSLRLRTFTVYCIPGSVISDECLTIVFFFFLKLAVIWLIVCEDIYFYLSFENIVYLKNVRIELDE